MKELKKKLVEEMKAGVVIYPPAKQIFNAFNLTPLDKVKVVISARIPITAKQENNNGLVLHQPHFS